MHEYEVTPTPDNSAEAQAQIFSGAGVARYGYSVGYDSSDKQAAFPNPTPLTEGLSKQQLAEAELLAEELVECADALGLSADSAEALVALRESITDPDEYQLVCETMYRVGVDLLRQAYRSMDEDITGGSNGGTKRARKQDTDETVRPAIATPQSPFRWARHHPTPVR